MIKNYTLENKKILFIIIFLCILFQASFIFAHPGRLDANGGHTDKSTGEYHYHKKTNNDLESKKKKEENKADGKVTSNRKERNNVNNSLEDAGDKNIVINSLPHLNIIIGIVAIVIIASISIYYMRANKTDS